MPAKLLCTTDGLILATKIEMISPALAYLTSKEHVV